MSSSQYPHKAFPLHAAVFVLSPAWAWHLQSRLQVRCSSVIGSTSHNARYSESDLVALQTALPLARGPVFLVGTCGRCVGSVSVVLSYNANSDGALATWTTASLLASLASHRHCHRLHSPHHHRHCCCCHYDLPHLPRRSPCALETPSLHSPIIPYSAPLSLSSLI